MPTVICTEKQVSVQVNRHYANAVLSALRSGARREYTPRSWGRAHRPPHSSLVLPTNLAVSDILTLQDSISRLEGLDQRNERDAGRLAMYRQKQSELMTACQDQVWKEPEWPYVAGLYKIRVPELKLMVDGEKRIIAPQIERQVLTVSDEDPIWPELKAVLLRQPRGNNVMPAPAFRFRQPIYKRDENMPKRVAHWLLEQAGSMGLMGASEVKAAS